MQHAHLSRCSGDLLLQFRAPPPYLACLDQGGSGSYNSHWEYELFQGDLMTPTKPADGSTQSFSRLTLALLQDTGWCVIKGWG